VAAAQFLRALTGEIAQLLRKVGITSPQKPLFFRMARGVRMRRQAHRTATPPFCTNNQNRRTKTL
jgi:hypothetical protein